MDIDFFFSANQFRTKKHVEETDIVEDKINEIKSSEEKLSNIKYKVFMCNGRKLNPKGNFIDQELEDGDEIIVICDIA